MKKKHYALIMIAMFLTMNIAMAGGRECPGGGCRPCPPPQPRPCGPRHYESRSLHSEDWSRLGIWAATNIISSAVAPRPVIVTGGSTAVITQPTYVTPTPIVIDPRPAVAPVATVSGTTVVVPSATTVVTPPAGSVVPLYTTPGGYYYNSVPVAPHGVVNYDGHGRPYVTPIKPGPGTHYYRPPAYPCR